MKEFTSAVEDIAVEDERNAKIEALIEKGKSREEAEAEVDAEDYVAFKLDGREMKAYLPTTGQLAFMLAATGRGQSNESRFAAILNILFESLSPEDKDYIEGRLLTRDPKRRLKIETIEEIFEHLAEEWFARPTQS